MTAWPPRIGDPCPGCGGWKDARAELCATCRFDPVARFWRNVTRTETCWLWKGWTTSNGYGRFRLAGRTRILAHRFAYELLVGPIPDGMELDHLCRNPTCVNPAHLEAVTHRENALRGTSPAAVHAAKTHCKRGHAFTRENTYIIPASGSRQCLTCKRAGRPAPKTSRRRLGLPG